MPETTETTTRTAALSQGEAIVYKAYARSFNGGGQVLCLLATCYYVKSGYTIFFDVTAGQYRLMEQPPRGIFRNMVTYYSACWSSSQRMEQVPAQVTVIDGWGQHVLNVEQW